MRVLTIVRSKWARANSDKDMGPSALLNGKGNSCCLGFDAMAVGIPTEFLRTSTPAGIQCKTPEGYAETRLRDWLGTGEYVNSDLVRAAIDINDDVVMQRTDEEKEEALIPILKELGGYDDVVFVD